ncbi:hypothetical protein O8W32_06685 [Methanomassiliicoccales archaeon LGM-DZ1]|nr:hypothetical protein O8W32_06685 [Methanomassiliicoccales archaeon LGM-DZ1]
MNESEMERIERYCRDRMGEPAESVLSRYMDAVDSGASENLYELSVQARISYESAIFLSAILVNAGVVG